MKWKQKKGNQATGENLAKAFEKKGYQQYADDVRRICGESGGGGGAPVGASAANTSSDNPPDLPTMWEMLKPVSNNWRNIGIMLSLDNGNLGVIEDQCRGVPANCLREMLSEWLNQTDPRPTKSALVRAVKTFNPALAEKISAL